MPEPIAPVEHAAALLWEEIRSGFIFTDEWGEYNRLPTHLQKYVSDALAAAGFFKLLRYANAVLAVESYLLNGHPPDIDHNTLVTELRFATKDVWNCPGVVPDPFNDEEMWHAILGPAPTD
jgi:hypothetical protein